MCHSKCKPHGVGILSVLLTSVFLHFGGCLPRRRSCINESWQAAKMHQTMSLLRTPEGNHFSPHLEVSPRCSSLFSRPFGSLGVYGIKTTLYTEICKSCLMFSLNLPLISLLSIFDYVCFFNIDNITVLEAKFHSLSS